VPDWIRPPTGVEGGTSGSLRPSRVFVPDWIRGPAPRERRPILIRGANCVIPGKGIFPLDVRTEGTIIQSIGVGLSGDGCDVVGAQGKYLIPGVVDPHTHIGLFAPFEVEAFTESRSAVTNGVTTMGVYLGGQESYLPILENVVCKIRDRSLADMFIHLPIFTKQQLEEIPLYASRYGVKSFKAYMCGIPGLIPSLDEGFLLDLMYAVVAVGPDAVLNVHAENYHIVDWATERAKTARPEEISLKEWSDTHPSFSEAEAIQRAMLLAEQTGARLYFVHVSSAEGLDTIRRLKREGKQFFAETTSPYLTISDETASGVLAKMVPPVRSEQDRDALWEGLRTDLLDTIGTDHTPLTMEQKQAGQGIWEAIPGYPAVGTHLPSLLDGARRKDFPFVKLVEKMTAAPARIFGLYPKKGTIFPGSDADLVILDLVRERTVSPGTAASRADYALHEGDELIGWPVAVFKSGYPVIAREIAHGTTPVKGAYLRRGR
jgi:dihydropyrimidinase